ncbi:alkaline phosphatase D family protein [Lapillicoccus jejuensis]|uniref:Alkaline phosphatase D n=1 Tax=Lapillicoccus jejuensis TaxID=402171 RepID=A0A542DYT6_9MICO|nr:alkaline phosphatase D family protein [Lapillicoccus jejuensis]TQJ08247.1 alkaline phosphatase D [Lapillicoccus jejuensis]
MTSTRPAPSRRTVLKGAAAAAGATALGVLRPFDEAVAAEPASQGVFGYGVASGDPRGNSVVIWTRATPPTRPGQPVATPGSGLGAPLNVRWEVAADAAFTTVVQRGHVMTSPDSDHTVKVVVTGLQPYTRYWYRFVAKGGTSPVGSTRTAPDVPGKVRALRLALVSCSNYTGGYFGAYRAIAARTDLDFVLHVGDYIYEYGNGADRYGPDQLIGVRDAQPPTETLDLRDYRLRHALHKADPDLRAAHAAVPFITIFDDHEVANNAWDDGAENHDPGEGSFLRRRRDAYQAYLEWMPFRMPDQQEVPHQGRRFFKRFTFGALADLSVLETRQNRSRQVDVAPFTTTGGGFIPDSDPAVQAQLADPTRHLPEPEQLAWLEEGLADGSVPWHLVGNQVVLTPVRFPGAALGINGVPELLNSDQWDGYQADQTHLLGHLAGLPAEAGDTVVLTGDIHSSWAMDLPATRTASYDGVGVEFVCPSVTSDGFYEGFSGALTGVPPEVVVTAVKGATAAVRATNPWISYLDGVGHGYVVVDVTPERVQADFHLTPTPTSAQPDPRVVPDVVPAYATSWQTLAGARRLSPATGPVGPRADEPRTAGRGRG